MSKTKLVFFIICLTWFLLLVILPFTLPSNTVDFGEHETNVSQNQIDKMNPVAGFVYSTGGSSCHQRASRSFFLNGNQMPYCSRCTGIFLGLVIGSCIAVTRYVNFKWQWIVIGLLPIGIDGIGQLFGFWESINPIRLITGMLAGILTGLAVAVIIQERCQIIKKIVMRSAGSCW